MSYTARVRLGGWQVQVESPWWSKPSPRLDSTSTRSRSFRLCEHSLPAAPGARLCSEVYTRLRTACHSGYHTAPRRLALTTSPINPLALLRQSASNSTISCSAPFRQFTSRSLALADNSCGRARIPASTSPNRGLRLSASAAFFHTARDAAARRRGPWGCDDCEINHQLDDKPLATASAFSPSELRRRGASAAAPDAALAEQLSRPVLAFCASKQRLSCQRPCMARSSRVHRYSSVRCPPKLSGSTDFLPSSISLHGPPCYGLTLHSAPTTTACIFRRAPASSRVGLAISRTGCARKHAHTIRRGA